MKRTVLASVAAAALVAAPVTAFASATQPPAPAKTEDITFVKHLTDLSSFTFQGNTAGAVHGQLTSQLLRYTAPSTDEYQFVEFRWTVASQGKSFVAITDGTLDTTTGVVAMTGTVTDGWHAGAEVLERGQLIDPATYTFTGDIVLLVR